MRHQVSCLFTLALVLVLSGASAFAASEDNPAQPTAHSEHPEQDLRVIDGDTLKIDGTTYRMWGIDAPEKGQQCERNEGEYYDCGAHSSLALKTIIGKNKVTCEKVNTDRYKRLVARCYLGGTMDLGSWMVNAGYAVEYKRYSKGYYQTEQDNAEEARRGLWAGDFTMPWEWRKERR